MTKIIQLTLTEGEAQLVTEAWALACAIGLKLPRALQAMFLQELVDAYHANHDAAEALSGKLSNVLDTLREGLKDGQGN